MAAPGAVHSIYYADLSKLNEMKRVGSESRELRKCS